MTPTEQRRAEFEAWSVSECLAPHTKVFAEYVWQAAADLYERKTLERARDVCKEHAKSHEHPIIKATALLCADAIERELKGGDANA